jgi:hypothetical protein
MVKCTSNTPNPVANEVRSYMISLGGSLALSALVCGTAAAAEATPSDD